jgi:NagD protein
MIGDTMETDILGGVQMGYTTVLVLSGGTQRDDLGDFAYAPDVILDSIADLAGPQADWNRLLPPTNLAEDSVPDLDRWWKKQAS